MKKIIYIFIIIIVFILGLSLGDDSYSKNQIIDNAKEEFENNIDNKDEYKTVILKPSENIFNKVANRIDNLIDSLINKVKEKV